MSKLKNDLLVRKKQIVKQLVELGFLKNKLEDINKALAALEPAKCGTGCTGCSICRGGPDYR